MVCAQRSAWRDRAFVWQDVALQCVKSYRASGACCGIERVWVMGRGVGLRTAVSSAWGGAMYLILSYLIFAHTPAGLPTFDNNRKPHPTPSEDLGRLQYEQLVSENERLL